MGIIQYNTYLDMSSTSFQAHFSLSSSTSWNILVSNSASDSKHLSGSANEQIKCSLSTRRALPSSHKGKDVHRNQARFSRISQFDSTYLEEETTDYHKDF